MGNLSRFNLTPFIERAGAKILVETGTGKGEGLECASEYPFEEIYSIEILPDQVEKLRPKFAHDPRIHLLVGESTAVLKDLIPKLKFNAIFWLDAHFPGADLHLTTHEEASKLTSSFPLKVELEMIRDMRPNFRDVILIDDLRIYEMDNFEEGNIRDSRPGIQWPTDSQFLYTTLEKTHTCYKFTQDHGYLAMIPK
jgi:hypothetical protein